MNDRFLPHTRRGLRCFRSGIGLNAVGLLITSVLFYVTALSPGAGLSLRWLQPVLASMGVVASGLMLVGILFMTACPAEAGVARWGIGILSLSALASLWPVVVYAADLPFGALSGPIGNAGIGLTAIQTVLLAGMLGTLCRWMASVERRAAACSGSALHSPEGAIETDPGAVWETLAGRCQRLVHGATTFLVALVIVALLASPFNPVPSLQPMRQPLLAILGGFAVLIWGIALLLRVVGAVWGVDRAVRRSARLAAGEERNGGGVAAERFGSAGMVAGALALGGLVANHWAEQVIAPGWVDRHIKEIVGNRPLGGRSAAIGQAAPAMTMKTIDGETVRLEDLAGKVVVLNFWATWCPPCVAEIPDLARLAKEVNQEGGVVIGISDEDVDTIRSFVASRDMPYAIVAGSDWPAPFNTIRAIPVTYFLDAEGTIREELVGGSSYEVFRRAFDAAKAPLPPLADPAAGALP